MGGSAGVNGILVGENTKKKNKVNKERWMYLKSLLHSSEVVFNLVFLRITSEQVVPKSRFTQP